MTVEAEGPDEAVGVLIVDDSADLRDLIGMVLNTVGTGFRVVGVAGDGEEAVEAVRRTRPNLVLLDIAMPVMDGIQALPHILEAAPDTVVVMLSGFGAATAGKAARDAGAHGYVEKEDLVRTLVPKIQQVLAAQRR